MALDPVSLTAMLAVFLVLSAKIETPNFKYTGQLAEILHELPAVLKEIPLSIRQQLLGGK